MLRRHRYPVTGAALAAKLGISQRSLYRDIITLQSQGARIDGAPGLGYVLRPGFTLPPLMFSENELEALSLGAQWVVERTDAEMSASARSALAKIISVLPPNLRSEIDASTVMVAPIPGPQAMDHDLPMRQAIRKESKMRINYRDGQDRSSQRIIWPMAFAYFEQVRMVVAWCEWRGGFRHFRVDRIQSLETLPERYPRRRQALMEAWRKQEGIETAGD